MYTIFKENYSILLTDKLKNQAEDNFYFYNNFTLKELLVLAENKKISIEIYHKDLDVLYKDFLSQFVVIEAAGGLVYNDKKELLFIFRNGTWDLPKGKVEKGELIAEAAVREVEEECGIEQVVLGDFFMKTHHIYDYEGVTILKRSHWYTMFSNATNLVPQLEEGITEVVWKSEEASKIAIQNTYANIKLLVDNSNL